MNKTVIRRVDRCYLVWEASCRDNDGVLLGFFEGEEEELNKFQISYDEWVQGEDTGKLEHE